MNILFDNKSSQEGSNPTKTPPGKTSFDDGGGGSGSRTSRVSASASTSASAAASSLDQVVDFDLSQLLYGPLIAFGGHSRVYRGKYKDQDVAIKVIESSEGAGSFEAGFEKHFIREITLLSRQNHPNIVKFIAAYTQDTFNCMVTEYLSGGSLRAYLNRHRQGTLPLERSVTFALDIARGMEYLHLQGVIHRDMKPENILIEAGSFRMKIADFGVSCTEGQDGCAIHDGELGSYRWMAPEMILGKAYGKKVDVYGFGLLLSEMVSGRIPFDGMRPDVAACAVINRNLRPDLPEDCPPPMRALIECCWASKHKKRPESSQIVNVLEGFKSSLAHGGTLQYVPELQSMCQPRKKRFLHKILRLGCVNL